MKNVLLSNNFEKRGIFILTKVKIKNRIKIPLNIYFTSFNHVNSAIKTIKLQQSKTGM